MKEMRIALQDKTPDAIIGKYLENYGFKIEVREDDTVNKSNKQRTMERDSGSL